METFRRGALLFAGAVLLMLFTQPSPGATFYTINPPDQPGFPVTLSGGAPIHEASSTLADLDGDPATLEIIVAGRDKSNACRGRVHAQRPDGSAYWNTEVRAPINSTPAVADVDHDGVSEVVVGLGGIFGDQCWHGGLVALDGRTGQVEWIFDTQDWLNHSPDGWLDGVYSSPAVGDVDGDGDLEIAFGAWDQCIYLLDGQGNPVWGEPNAIPEQSHCGGHGFYNEDTVWSSPALADLDGNGTMEIIIGADITEGNRYGLPSGGFVYVLRHDGAQLARRWHDQRMYSSPAIADLDRDGKLEIVVGTGNHLKDRGYYVKVYTYEPSVSAVSERLAQKWHLATSGPVFASPSIGDLNGDGYQDVSVISYVGNPPWFEDGTFDGMKSFAWSGRDGTKLFETPVCDSWNQSGITPTSTVIGGVGESGEEGTKVLFGHSGEVGVLTGQGTYYSDPGSTYDGNCRGFQHATDLTYWTDWLVYSTPSIGDIDSDGKVEVVLGASSYNDEYAKLYAWEPGASAGTLSWPMFRQNRFHTGNASTPELTASASDLVIPHALGDSPPPQAIRVVNGNAGSILKWSASVSWTGSQAADWFTLDRSTGETPTSDTVTLDLDPAKLTTPGTYRAQITFTGAAGTLNSPLVVDVEHVVSGPTLDVDPDNLNVLMEPSGPATVSREVLVQNAGGSGAIAWRTTTGAGWLSLQPSSGSTDQDPYLTLTIDRRGLSNGHHTATVRVTATAGEVEDPEETITVHLYVGPVHKSFLPTVLRAGH